jgi:hypothetical protein
MEEPLKTKLSLVKVNGKDKLYYNGKGSFYVPVSYLELLVQNVRIVIKPRY